MQQSPDQSPATHLRPTQQRRLNYQIEHHVFPSMPRPNLRRSQALIEAFCRLRGVPYCQSSLAGSYAQALRYLNTVGRPARPGAASAAAARP
jgi:fatty acid desaturase